MDRPNHLKEWREEAGLSQQALADLIGSSKSVISDLETGKLRLSPPWLNKIAPHVGATKPGHILDYTPHTLPNQGLPDDVVILLGQIPEDRMPQALEVLRTFVPKSDTGQDG